MLMNVNEAALLVVDIQEKLVPALFNREVLPARAEWLIGAAVDLGLPIVFTEQYPKGLGPTLPSLLAKAPQAPVAAKVAFSCVAGQCLPESVMGRSQFIVMGVETHVCVLQTVFELLALGKRVFVVTDVTGSRREQDHAVALKRMRDGGAVRVTREMVVFEMLRQAGTDLFKRISKGYLTDDLSPR